MKLYNRTGDVLFVFATSQAKPPSYMVVVVVVGLWGLLLLYLSSIQVDIVAPVVLFLL